MPARGLNSYDAYEFEKLIWYDSAWTSYAADPQLIRSEPLDAIDVARNFASAINVARFNVERVASEIAEAERFREIPASLRELLSEDETGQIVLNAVDEHDGVAALAANGASDVVESAPEALEMLEGDLRKLFSGEAAPGYLPDRFLCGMAKFSMAAGLVTVWVPPHAHAAAAVAFGAAVYKATRCHELRGAH
jgi:hypothetical protein